MKKVTKSRLGGFMKGLFKSSSWRVWRSTKEPSFWSANQKPQESSSWNVWWHAKESSSWRVLVQDLVVYNNRNTTDAGLKPSSMTLSYNGKSICHAGFTLIELLVVVLIIGILAAVALPQYQKAVLKARSSEALVQGKALLAAEQAYVLSNGVMSMDLDALDVTLPENFRWECTNGYCSYRRLVPHILYEINNYFGRSRPALWCIAGSGKAQEKQMCASQGEFHHTNTSNNHDYYLILK